MPAEDAGQDIEPRSIESADDLPQVYVQTRDGDAYDLVDLIEWHAKNLDIAGTGDVKERVMESLEALSEADTDDDERMRKIRKRFTGKTPSVPRNRKVVEGKEKLWCFRDTEYTGPSELGSGDLVCRALGYQHRNHFENESREWSKVRKMAEERGDQQMVDAIDKSQAANDFTLGGAILPEPVAADLIGFLFDQTVLRQAGAMVVDMPNGRLDFGKITSTVTASWVGETGTANASDVNFGRVELNAKKMKITNVMSNDLIRQSPRGLVDIIRRQLRQRASVEADTVGLRGTGANGQPAGLYQLVANGQKFDRAQNSSTSSLEEITQDIFKMIYKVVQNNIPMDRPGFIMHSREKWGLGGKTDADGNLTQLFDMLDNGMLIGFPVYTTNAIKTDLGGGDESRVYFGDAAQLILGETLNTRIRETEEATVTDSNGNALDLWDEDQRALQILHEIDYALTYDTAFSIAEKVDWGVDVVG